jgi:hypothetical protein
MPYHRLRPSFPSPSLTVNYLNTICIVFLAEYPSCPGHNVLLPLAARSVLCISYLYHMVRVSHTWPPRPHRYVIVASFIGLEAS